MKGLGCVVPEMAVYELKCLLQGSWLILLFILLDPSTDMGFILSYHWVFGFPPPRNICLCCQRERHTEPRLHIFNIALIHVLEWNASSVVDAIWSSATLLISCSFPSTAPTTAP